MNSQTATTHVITMCRCHLAAFDQNHPEVTRAVNFARGNFTIADKENPRTPLFTGNVFCDDEGTFAQTGMRRIVFCRSCSFNGASITKSARHTGQTTLTNSAGIVMHVDQHAGSGECNEVKESGILAVRVINPQTKSMPGVQTPTAFVQNSCVGAR